LETGILQFRQDAHLTVHALPHLFPVDTDVLRRIDSDPHLISLDTQDPEGGVLPYTNSLTGPSR
jgi:hypothetical protein